MDKFLNDIAHIALRAFKGSEPFLLLAFLNSGVEYCYFEKHFQECLVDAVTEGETYTAFSLMYAEDGSFVMEVPLKALHRSSLAKEIKILCVSARPLILAGGIGQKLESPSRNLLEGMMRQAIKEHRPLFVLGDSTLDSGLARITPDQLLRRHLTFAYTPSAQSNTRTRKACTVLQFPVAVGTKK